MKDFYGNANDANPKDVEERRTRLKSLIVLGKERGYLTYAEINDHLPDEIQEYLHCFESIYRFPNFV